jgi:predicted nuclease of predicted toxin-antitoxin system
MTVNGLRELGHDVRDIRGTPEQGLSDPDLWQMAKAEARLLVTTDKGFTEYRSSLPHYGILVVRLRQPNKRKIHAAVMGAIGRFQSGEWLNLHTEHLAFPGDRFPGAIGSVPPPFPRTL